MLSVSTGYDGAEAFVFIVPRDEDCAKPQLQVLLAKHLKNCLLTGHRSQSPSLLRRLSS
jgi:hypothetical protein